MEVALPWVALAVEEVAHLMAQVAGDLQWEVQAVAVLLMEATEQEVALPWVALVAEEVAHLMVQAADDRLWEAPAREVDDLRWVDQETGLHQVEELPSPNFSKRHSTI